MVEVRSVLEADARGAVRCGLRRRRLYRTAASVRLRARMFDVRHRAAPIRAELQFTAQRSLWAGERMLMALTSHQRPLPMQWQEGDVWTLTQELPVGYVRLPAACSCTALP